MLGFVETGRLSSSHPNLQNCFPPSVEILTRRGWVRFDTLRDSDVVAQFEPTTEVISFVRPTRRVCRPYAGDLVRIETDEQIRLTMTPDHRCLSRQRRGARAWVTSAPDKIPTDQLYYHAGRYTDGTVHLSDAEVTLLCAAQADGSWEHVCDSIRFTFTKQRKIDRLRGALDTLGAVYRQRTDAVGRTTFYIGCTTGAATTTWLMSMLGRDKEFGPWLLNLDQDTLCRFVRETTLWDGLSTRGTEYFSVQPVNVDWVQIACTLTGMRAQVCAYHNGDPNARELGIVRWSRRGVPYSMTTNMRRVPVSYVGNVYCVTVPSGYILVRQEGAVAVTGNCSDSADERIDTILGWGKGAAKGSPEAARRFVSRSIFRARSGWFLADADLMGAEIAAAGWKSGDALLIEHARRATLPESDPEWLDLHSDLAAGAFGLTCSLAEVKAHHKALRVAAKRARFGHYYGASPETIHRQCLLDSPDVTLDQVRKIVIGHDAKYKVLAEFFAKARRRVGAGWLRNEYGGTRRFPPVGDRELRAAQERAAQNWTCQGLVADHISEALGKLWYAVRDQGLRSRLVLTIHDSVVMECPPEEIAFVVDELLPWAMGWGTPVYPVTLEGEPLGRGPYVFGVSVKVNEVWGVDCKDWRERAVRYAATNCA
jgi:hypothetical protein